MPITLPFNSRLPQDPQSPDYQDLQDFLTTAQTDDPIQLASLRDQRKGELEDRLAAATLEPPVVTKFGGEGGDPKDAEGRPMITPNPNAGDYGRYDQLLGILSGDIAKDPNTGDAVKAAVAQGFQNPAEAAGYGRQVAAQAAGSAQNLQEAQAELARSQAVNNPVALARLQAQAQADRLQREGAFGPQPPEPMGAPAGSPNPLSHALMTQTALNQMKAKQNAPPVAPKTTHFTLGPNNESVPLPSTVAAHAPTAPAPTPIGHNLSDPNQFKTHIDAKGNMSWAQVNTPAQLANRQAVANSTISQIDRLEQMGVTLDKEGLISPITSALYSAGYLVGKGPTAAAWSFSHPTGDPNTSAKIAAFYQGLDMLGPTVMSSLTGSARGGAIASMTNLINHARIVGRTDITGLKGTLQEMRSWLEAFKRGSAPGEDAADANLPPFYTDTSDQDQGF